MSSGGYLRFWAGVDVAAPDLHHKDGRFPIRCYFDNDSDELINFRSRNGQVNVTIYREMIRSLKAMGYNAVDIHDQLGRREFYEDEAYCGRWSYRANLDHIDELVDAVHEEGLLVQIPMYLCWQFRSLREEQECWTKYSREWIDLWRHYLKCTPLGKGDIFLFRPRSPLWDSRYRCRCEECERKGVGAIMSDAFSMLEKEVLAHNSNAILVCDLYSQGARIWQQGDFQPSSRWIMVCADNGYGKLVLPENAGRPSHKWGIYLHAGFWLNHTVQDPHVDALAQSIRRADRQGANQYMLVNGQSFKNFVLNLEVCMAAAADPEGFDAPGFLRDWATRMFGRDVADDVAALVRSVAEAHLASTVGPAYLDPTDFDRGFVALHRGLIYPLLSRISNESCQPVHMTIAQLEASFTTWCRTERSARAIAARMKDGVRAAFDDQLCFPVRLSTSAVQFGLELANYVGRPSQRGLDAVEVLLSLLNGIAERGSELSPFPHWHAPRNARPVYPIVPCGSVKRRFGSGGQ